MREAGDIAEIVAGAVAIVDSADVPNEQKKAAVIQAVLQEAKDLGINTPSEKLRPIVSIGIEVLIILGKLVGALRKRSGNDSQATPGTVSK